MNLVELISTVGFPIVCAAALFWYVVKHQNDMQETMIKEGKENREVISANTLVLTQILEHMREGDSHK